MSTVRRRRTALVVAIASIAAIGVVVDVATSGARRGPWSADLVTWLGYGLMTVVGVVVVLARPENRIGWYMLAGGALSTAAEAALDVADALPAHDAALVSAVRLTGLVARTYGWFVMTGMVVSTSPDGHTLPGRWRRLPRVVLLAATCVSVNTLFDVHANLTSTTWRNPLSTRLLSDLTGPLSLLGIAGYVGSLGFAVAQLVLRFRRGDALARQQIGVLAAVAILPAFAVLLGVFQVLGGIVFGIALLPLPVAIGYAVLARGLYDLATATNRGAVWLVLSAVVFGIYALVIGVIGGSVGDRAHGWLPWVAAAIATLVLLPLRDVVQRAVNRITFGRWDDPYAVLSRLGQDIEASADVDALLRHVVTELESTLGLTDVAVLDEAGRLVAGTPPTEQAETVTALAYGQPVGALRFSTSTTLRDADRRLVDDLAAHVGVLLHARHADRDLRRARERLVLAREEERRRLRRDLHDGLGPALAGHLLRVDLASQSIDAGSPARAVLDGLRDDLRGTITDVRRVVEGLRPPSIDEVGLTQAITQAATRLTSGSPVRCHFEMEDTPALSAAAEVAAYRIAIEAVTNAVKHSEARHCVVRLSSEDHTVVLSVSDDGRGLGARGLRRGHGLETMRERAEEIGGTMEVASASGTTVTARIPVPAKEEQG